MGEDDDDLLTKEEMEAIGNSLQIIGNKKRG